MLRIRHVLDARGITMKRCAELLCISQKALYNKIVGKTDFMYSEVKKLSTLFPEYNIDFLLTEEPAERG
jgi:hypothetical protein